MDDDKPTDAQAARTRDRTKARAGSNTPSRTDRSATGNHDQPRDAPFAGFRCLISRDE